MGRLGFTAKVPEPARVSARGFGRLVALLAVAVLAGLLPARASATGRVQGKVIAADSGEPVGFADLLLLPADTTMRRVGMLSNADGTFLLVAPAGRYALQVRALSYARKRIGHGVLLQIIMWHAHWRARKRGACKMR